MTCASAYIITYIIIISSAINAVLQRGDIWSSVGQPQCGHIRRCMYEKFVLPSLHI